MKKLMPPINDISTLKALNAGDKVLISGTIYTARDQAHLRLIDEPKPPFELEGSIIYYVGPTPSRENQIIGSCGPTSAYRMDELAVPLMRRGVKLMIGKGNRSKAFREKMIEEGAVYLMATGGAGALLASKVKKRKLLMYEDLGPEAIYELEVEDFPCFVAYDLHGNSIFSEDNHG